MQQYDFTGHLTPLPPGVKLPLQLSGKVYLVPDVHDELQKRNERISELEATLREARDYALYRRNHSSIARAILQLIRPTLGKGESR